MQGELEGRQKSSLQSSSISHHHFRQHTAQSDKLCSVIQLVRDLGLGGRVSPNYLQILTQQQGLDGVKPHPNEIELVAGFR